MQISASPPPTIAAGGWGKITTLWSVRSEANNHHIALSRLLGRKNQSGIRGRANYFIKNTVVLASGTSFWLPNSSHLPARRQQSILLIPGVTVAFNHAIHSDPCLKVELDQRGVIFRLREKIHTVGYRRNPTGWLLR